MSYNHIQPQVAGADSFTAYSRLKRAYALAETPGYESLAESLRQLVNLHADRNGTFNVRPSKQAAAFHELLWLSSLWRLPYTLRSAQGFATMDAVTAEEKSLSRCAQSAIAFIVPKLSEHDEEFLVVCHELLYSTLSKVNSKHFESVATTTFHLCDSLERAIKTQEPTAYAQAHEAAKSFVYDVKDKHGTTPEWRELLDKLEVRALLQGYSLSA